MGLVSFTVRVVVVLTCIAVLAGCAFAVIAVGAFLYGGLFYHA